MLVIAADYGSARTTSATSVVSQQPICTVLMKRDFLVIWFTPELESAGIENLVLMLLG